MTIRIVCSGCGAAYQVPDNLLGKKVKCRKCEQGIAVAPAPVHVPAPPAESAPRPAAAPPPAAAPQPRKAPPPEDEVLSVLPATPRPARRRAEEDEAPPRPAKGPRRPKGHLTPLTAVAAALAILALLGAVVLATGYVLSSYFGKKGNDQARPATPTIPFFGEGPFAGPEAESFLMERRPDLEAYFRAPEEPPSGGLEFTEPPAAGAEAPKLIKNTTGQLTPAVLQKVKGSTVYLRVKSAQGESEGSGFFGGVPGVVVTNAHVVGMLARGAPAPTSVRVVRNKGEKDEATFPAKVVAVDHDADLALLSVPAKGMPAPLVVKSAQGLQETQVVYVAGFPLGELPGKSITINKYELSSLKKEKGALDKLQVHGDMQPGNSGGPLLDADGEVVGVCVAVLRNTRINFAVPGDKVCRFLDGHLAELALETPARVDGQLRVPVSVRLVDPLGRLRQVGLDVWVGKPGPGRPASRTAPAPQPGDGPRQTLAVEIREQTGRGELTLPPLPEGQAYWLQPALVNRDGGRVWLSAQVYQPPPPVERKPARLVLRPAGDWPLTLERWSALQFPDPRGRDHRALVRLEARLTDVSQGRQGDDLALSRRFTGLKEGVAVDGEVHMTRRLQRLAPHIQFLAVNRLVDGRGTAKRDAVDTDRLQQAPAGPQREMIGFGGEVVRFLQGLEVALPGEQVEPGATWKARRPLPLDPTWRAVAGLPPQIWGTDQPDALEVMFTYLGVRTVNGAEQAVLSLRGQTVRQPGREPGPDGRLSGTAVVDLATGQVVEEEVTTQVTVELVLPGVTAIRAHGTVLARLRRE